MNQKRKTNISIFYGPRKEFDKLIKKKTDKEYFVSIVQEHDEQIKMVLVKADGEKSKESHIKREIKNLIINSDEYSTITEAAIQNFIAILDYFDIKNVYLQNPPSIVVEKLKKVYNDKVEEKFYEYGKLDLKIIKNINNCYSTRIIGQDKAIRELLRSLLTFDKFPKSSKPIVLMFYGPSGVGKTETAKYLSEQVGGELFYKQFSMFQNNDFLTYLFGGLHSQNSFAKELYDRPSNVILLDEFDKANNCFYSAFYQLFDEGTYIDKNYTVQLDNAIIICTSNFSSKDEIRENLGDPIYYRFDAFIEFDNLGLDAMKQIIDLRYNDYVSELSKEDKKLIEDFRNTENLSIKEIFYKYASKMKNARNINTVIKEFILDVLLDGVIKND